jgi:hypothetical protein
MFGSLIVEIHFRHKQVSGIFSITNTIKTELKTSCLFGNNFSDKDIGGNKFNFNASS